MQKFLILLNIVVCSLAMPVENKTNVEPEVNHALDPSKAILGVSPLLLPQDTLPLDVLVRSRKDTESLKVAVEGANEDLVLEENETMDLAESHVFLPKFSYQAVQARRRRVRVPSTN